MKFLSFFFKSSSLVTRTLAQVAVVGTVGTLSLGVMSSSAFTSLNAVASNPSPVVATSGTLIALQAHGVGSAGFDSGISNMTPGDTVNRYVNFTNSGNLPATGLTLSVADGTSSLLTNLAGSTAGDEGLHVTVSSCTSAWNMTTGACDSPAVAGPAALASTSLYTLTQTAGTLISSPTAIAAGATEYLKFSIALPNKSETTTNGTFPTGTIQGLSASLTWTLTEVQAAAATTNS